MKTYLSALISMLMIPLVSSECFQLTGSTACPAFSGSFVSSTKDFSNVETLDSFVMKRVGQVNTNKLYIESFRSSYGCPKYQGGQQEHLLTMFCAQLAVGSQSVCKKAMAAPLCRNTCQDAIKSLVSIFRSSDCTLSDTNPNFAKIKENRDETIQVYYNLCYKRGITSNKVGCIINAAASGASETTSIAPQAMPSLASPSLPIAHQTTIGSAESSPEQSDNVQLPEGPSSNPTNPKAEAAQAIGDSTSNAQDSSSNTSNNQESGAPASDNNGLPVAPLESVATVAKANLSADSTSDSEANQNRQIDQAPESEVSSPETPASSSTDAAATESNPDESPIEPPPAVAPDFGSEDDSVNSDINSVDPQQDGEAGSSNSNTSDGGPITENKTMLWAIIGTSIALLLALLVGLLIYRRKKSEDSENPFKGTSSLGSYGSSSNDFVTSNDGIVSRPYYPELPDEVALNVGNRVEVLEVYDDGWALGDNINSGLRGIFPLQCIEPMEDNIGNPASPSSRVSSLYSINKFYGKGYS